MSIETVMSHTFPHSLTPSQYLLGGLCVRHEIKKDWLAEGWPSVETTVEGGLTRSSRGIVDYSEYRGRLILINHCVMRQMMDSSIFTTKMLALGQVQQFPCSICPWWWHRSHRVIVGIASVFWGGWWVAHGRGHSGQGGEGDIPSMVDWPHTTGHRTWLLSYTTDVSLSATPNDLSSHNHFRWSSKLSSRGWQVMGSSEREFCCNLWIIHWPWKDPSMNGYWSSLSPDDSSCD